MTGLDLDSRAVSSLPALGQVTRANWRFLPAAHGLSPAELLNLLREHFSQFLQAAGLHIELDRITFALSLAPRQICVGIDDFAGYYAFVLGGDAVLFECPVYGNAAYVVKGDWQTLSQMHKCQLTRRGLRIIHTNRQWRARLKAALRALDGRRAIPRRA